MTSVSVDGQGLLASGRRVVLVSGTVAYSRIAPESWATTLDAIKRQGFNTIEAPVIWREHEPREGAFEFKAGRDLAGFIKLAGEKGLWVIVRLGIAGAEDWDMGGMPSWLNRHVEPTKLRSNAPEFLERASKFIAKACQQFNGMQVTTGEPNEKSCVIAVQCEHLYECGDRTQAEGYLGQLHRYIRESAVSIPVLNANNLFAYVDGQIETWCGSEELLASMRQMRVIEPNNPLHVSHLPIAPVRVWGEKNDPTDRRTLARRLAQALAAGASFTISDAAAGSRWGFTAGRTHKGFATTDTSHESLFDGDGRPLDLAPAARRVCLFAKHFAKVLGAAHPEDDHAAVAVDANGPTIIERRSAMGTVVFVFDDPAKKRGSKTVEILLRDGRRCEVDPGPDGVAWALSGVSLGGRARLDLATASAIALVGAVFVCAAHAGANATIVMNGSMRTLKIPRGKKPEIFQLEGITVVAANEAHIDEIEINDQTVDIPAAATRILPDGTREKLNAPTTNIASRAPSLNGWAYASSRKYITGEADRFALIEGPTSMERLGVGEGYGWLRIDLKTTAALRKKLALPQSADRVHIYRNGEFAGIFGNEAFAEDGLTIPIPKGDTTLGVLVDNLGRRSTGNMMGESKGVWGHLYETANIKTTTETVEREPTRALELRSPLFGVERGELLDARRIRTTFTHRKKSPLDVRVAPLPVMSFLFLNDELLGVIDPDQRGRWVLDQDALNRGKNELELALLGDATDLLPDMRKALTVTECEKAVTEKAGWAYAKWEPPANGAYEPVNDSALKGKAAAARKGAPGWWRCEFQTGANHRSLFLDTTGLSKGQAFINGLNAGRYWVATDDGKPFNGAARVHIPRGAFDKTGKNTLVIFDEHGFSPAKCRLVYG